MAHAFAKASPRQELAGLVLALSGMLLLLALVQFHGLRLNMVSDLGSAAELIAQNASHAIVIENDAEARDLLAALVSSRNIRQARLESRDGRLLAVYDGGLSHWSHALVSLKVSRPVIAYGAPVGVLVLSASSQKLVIWTLVFLGVGSLAIASACLASWVSAKRAAKAARKAQQSVAWISRHDPLTGCANREELRRHLQQSLGNNSAGSALYLIDLDGFGVINAAYGAQQGDVILRVIAQRLQTLLAPEDCLARLSADEFGIAQARCEESAVSHFAWRIQAALREPIFIGDIAFKPSACLGMALLPTDGEDADSAIRAASAALSMARSAGHGSVCRYQEAHDRELRERADLIEALRQALTHEELYLQYQPIYTADQQVLCGAEALLRWRHPMRGAISPERFIPLAESSGLIEELGLKVLSLLHADRKHWLAQGLQVPAIAVNLSAMQFPDEAAKARFLQHLDSMGLGPDAIEIELTERAAFEDLETTDSIVHQLKSKGFSISLDDFGTGYSSLSYLHRLSCDKLKIDRSFVRRMEQNPNAQQLVRAIVEVAHAFQMKTVAEGVETQGEFDALKLAGCDAMQGYLLDRPMTAHRFGQRLAEIQLNTMNALFRA